MAAAKGGYLVGGDRLGRYGDDQIGQRRTGRDETGKVAVIHRADQGRIMGPLAGQGKMRAFQMQADKSGHRLLGGTMASRDGGNIDRDRVGYQGWQQRGGAEFGMGSANCPNAGERGIIVEQHAAAPIDLQIHKAGDNAAARQLNLFGMRRHIAGRYNRRHHAELDQQGSVIVPDLTIKDLGARYGQQITHSVSVTFLRATGRSGLKPRWRDKASTKP